jgi:Tol biopolymer transport system component
MADKKGDGWSEPRCLNLVVRYPELKFAAVPRVARNGALYFVAAMAGPDARMGIYRTELVNGEYARPQPLSPTVNRAPFTNWAPFVAPDETYLLFSSNRRDPDNDPGDLYISRRQADGSWSEPVSLGPKVNSPAQEVFPGISPDGKYLFFCRDTAGRQNDVYWVRTSGIKALR